MINKWILDNFKSIASREELEFRPLTIFSGANSSGKSTILQSILLVTQTLQNQSASKSIVLNGWFKKFGSYSDIVTGRDITKNIHVGFTISDIDDEDEIWARRRIHMRMQPQLFYEDERYYTNCEFVLSSAGKKDNLQPELEKVSLEYCTKQHPLYRQEAHKWEKRTEIEEKVYSAISERIPSDELSYTLKNEGTMMNPYNGDDLPWKPIGVKFNHFLPECMIGYCSLEEQAKVLLKRFLLMGSSYYYELDHLEKKIVPLIEDKALEIVNQLFNKGLIKLRNSERAIVAINKSFTLKRLQSIFRASVIGEDDKRKYINQITDKLSALNDEYNIEPIYIHRQPATDMIRSYFRNRINYLGPLREEPKSLYPLSNDGSTTDIGLKGENTAAVYDNNKDEIVNFISPDCFEDPFNVSIKSSVVPLSEAVRLWLKYMGVANDVITDDKGKMGHSLQVSNESSIKQDLTHVGVGVSQVLPILVMSLLAKKGDAIILEQPELHLHPKVQTRLADFFVAMNALGKQCIIETHSEYLINRLRFLVATSKDSKIADDTMIYFVNKTDGHSNYHPVTINKYGVIEDWPDGFFDESEKIAADILRAGMEKKMQEEGIEYEE